MGSMGGGEEQGPKGLAGLGLTELGPGPNREPDPPETNARGSVTSQTARATDSHPARALRGRVHLGLRSDEPLRQPALLHGQECEVPLSVKT